MDILNTSHAPYERTTRRRRRERPGARTRHALSSMSRKDGLQYDVAEGIDLAHGTYRLPPFESAKPSPLRRQTFDQSWQRWKAREIEQKAQADMHALAIEQHRLFGGDVDDDELRALGLLYNQDEDLPYESNIVHDDIFPDPYVPTFRVRNRRPGRKSTSVQLPLFLSFSFLSNDSEIIRLMNEQSPAHSTPTAVQERDTPHLSPQSLPPIIKSSTARIISSPLLFPLAGDDEDLADSAWEIISSISSTPSLGPETWTLLGDD